MQAGQLNQRAQQVGDFVRSDVFKYVIGGSLIALAIIMLIGSFAFSWVSTEFTDTEDSTSISAMQIWMGGNDDIKTLDVEAEFDDEGFGAVRLLDRFLILLPLAALLLIVVAAAYMFLLKNLPWLTVSRALIAMAIISCFLLLFPLIWESLSINNWSNAKGVSSRDMLLLGEVLSTTEQQILGFLAFLIAMVGLVLYTLSEQGALGTPRAVPPQSGMPYQAPPPSRPMPPRPGQPEPSIPSPQPPPPPSQS